MQLTTSRFVLRDFTLSDETAFADYHADTRYHQYYGPGENTPESARQLVRTFMAWAEEEPRKNYQLAITYHDSLTGCCGLRMKEARPGTAEFGIELAPAYWGRFGYALEPMLSLLDYGFRELELQQITGSSVSANARISRMAKALGANATAVSTPDWMTAKGWQQLVWSIDRERWLKRPASRWF